jgi:hypothetical protein
MTGRARAVFAAARKIAIEYRVDDITPEHLLLALSERDQGVGRILLERCGLDLEEAFQQIYELVPPKVDRKFRQNKPGLDATVRNILAWSREEAFAFGDNYVGTEHLVLGILRDSDSPASDFLRASGVSIENARTQLRTIPSPPRKNPLAVIKNQQPRCRCGHLARHSQGHSSLHEFDPDTETYALRLSPSELVENAYCPICGGLDYNPLMVNPPLCCCGSLERWDQMPSLQVKKKGKAYSLSKQGRDGWWFRIDFCPACGGRFGDESALQGRLKSPLTVVLMRQRRSCRCGSLAKYNDDPDIPFEYTPETDSYTLRLSPSELVENVYCLFCGGMGYGPTDKLPLCHCGAPERWTKDPSLPVECGETGTYSLYSKDKSKAVAVYFCPACGWRARDNRALEGDS